MYKAILFCRVSSDKQTLDRQITDLTPVASRDGYTDSDIKVIQHKESATKNDIYNRKSIRELTELIESNPIEAVYVTEISRLARRNDVLYQVLSLLESKKICLVVLQPVELRTIRNGKPNPEAMLIIQFFSYLAVSESQIKVERQKSGIKQKTLEGCITTSKLKFGYSRTPDNKAIENKEEAEAVRDIFDMYLNGSTIGQIWQKYDHTGLFPMLKRPSGEGRIIKILKDVTYIGQHKKYQYPQLVDVDLFSSVQERLASRVVRKESTKVVYFCKNIIKIFGRTMTPQLDKKSYMYDDRVNRKRYSINVNVIDSLAKNNACEALASMNNKNAQEGRKRASEGLKTVNMKLSQIDGIVNSLNKEKERLNDMFQKGRIKESDYDFKYIKVEEEIEHTLKEKEELQNTQLQLKNMLSQDSFKLGSVRDYYSMMDITDPIEVQKLVREAVKCIKVNPIDKGRFRIEFDYHDQTLNRGYWYEYIVRGCKIYLYRHYADDLEVEDFSNTWEKRI